MRYLLLSALTCACAFAAISLPLEKGVAVATCFPGWKSINPPVINLDSPVVGLVDVRNPASTTTGTNWQPDMFHNETSTAPVNQWTARRMGLVFGIAIDKRGNIFVAASRIYGIQGITGDTAPGLWGSAGSGGVYRIDRATGNVTDFITTNNAASYTTAGGNSNKIPNTGSGLGNLAYDKNTEQLFVTNFEDGKIYRLSGLTQNTGTIAPAPYDPFNPDDGLPGFSDPGLKPGNGNQIGERIWGIGVFNGRVYFSVWAEDVGRFGRGLTNSIHSVAITAAGTLNGTTLRKEVDIPNMPGRPWSNPVSDIEFSSGGRMLVAERSQLDQSVPASVNDLVDIGQQAAHRSRVIEFRLSGPLNNVYTPFLNPLHIGETSWAANSNSAGGVDYGYLEYDNELDQLAGCEKMIWASGDYLRNTPNGLIYGLQGTISGVNTPSTADDYFIDLNGVLGTQDKVKIGDVDVFRDDCGSDAITDVPSSYLECVNEGTGKYNLNITVVNNNADPVSGAVVLLPNGSSTNVTFNPPLAPGATTTVSIPITIGAQTTGSLLTFVFQFHGKPLPPPLTYQFCDKPLTVSVRVPECGCITATLIRIGVTGSSLALYIKNHVVDPNATFVTINSLTPGITITPGSLNLSIPYGGTALIPVNIAPAPAVGAFVKIAITLHGKKLGNGYFESCCMEEAEYPIPRQVVNTTIGGVYGNVFLDLNTDLRLDPREPRLPGISVTYIPEKGERIVVRTNDSGEYFIPLAGEAVRAPYTLVADASNARQRCCTVRSFAAVPGGVPLGIVNFAVAPIEASVTAPEGLPASSDVLDLEAPDTIGGTGSSAIRYSVPTGLTTLRLLDSDGNDAGTIAHSHHEAGDYIAIIRSHDWQPGIYTLELSIAGDSQQRVVSVLPSAPPTPFSAAKQAGVTLFRLPTPGVR